MPSRPSRATTALIALLALGSVPSAASAMVMLYDTAPAVRAIATGPGALSAEGHDLYQQQPVAAVLAPNRQAWKVSGRGPCVATPGLRGRSANSMADLLADRVRRSGGRLVFIDEAGVALNGHGDDAANLATALELLRLRTVPGIPAGQSVADRVHIYVQGVPAPLARPVAWDDTWRALALAGGVWWQSYTSNRAWNAAEWATWGPLIQRRFAEWGGDPGRLRWVVRHYRGSTLADQFTSMLTGDSCQPTANGIGAWRVGPEATAFRDLWAAVSAGTMPCTAAPAVSAAGAAGLHAITALEAGAPLPTEALRLGAQGIGRLAPGSVPVGVPVRLRLDLGADPLAIAAALGVDPAQFWAEAGATVTIRGAGVDQRLGLSGLPLDTYVVPRSTGRIELRIHLPSRALRTALGGERVDLLGALQSVGGPRTAALERRLIQSPAGVALSIPLRASGGAMTIPVRTAPGTLPRRAQLLLPARLSGGRIAPRHLRPLAVRLRDARGLPVAGARVIVRLPGGRTQRARSDRSGVARLAVARRGGAHVVTVPGTTIRVVRALVGPRR